MKVLLVNTPVDYRLPDSWRSESLGLGYVTAVLRSDGHHVEILDAHLQHLTPRETADAILAREFDCLGFTAAQAHLSVLRKIIPTIRRARPDAIITVGGYLPTLTAEYFLSECPGVDFIVRGEGEISASDVFGRIARGDDWRAVPGVGYLADGKATLNPPPPPVADLDSLPFPARDGLGQAKIPVVARVATSRGCFHRCSFCCVPSFYGVSGARGQRARSPETVVAEIESVIDAFDIREFAFSDDDFLGPSKKTIDRVSRLAQAIIDRKLGISFSMECRPDEVNDEVVALLKEAGLRQVFLGIESGIQRQLDTYSKGVTVEQNKRAIELIRGYGIPLRCGYIMFDPYLTLAELQESMQFCTEMGLIRESKRTPVPFVTKMALHRGVPIMEDLRRDGLLREKGAEVDWVFRRKSVGAVWAFLCALGSCSEAFHHAKSLIARKEPQRSAAT